MTRKFEGSGPTEGMPSGSGFEAWLARRAAKGATAPTTTDRDYLDYVAAMRGAEAERMAGVPTTGTPGGADPAEGIPDSVVYAGYLAELDGTAARRRSEENAKRERIEREDEIVRHARMMGGGLSRSHEALRSRLEGFGRPHEGS